MRRIVRVARFSSSSRRCRQPNQGFRSGWGRRQRGQPMMAAQFHGVEFVVANTDVQALHASPARQAPARHEADGGTGRRLEPGGRAERRAGRSRPDPRLLSGADMVSFTAGARRGTGTGAAPGVASLRSHRDPTVAVVTKPFVFEGRKRMLSRAGRGVRGVVDTLITIFPTSAALPWWDRGTPLIAAFAWQTPCCSRPSGISDLILVPGLVNLGSGRRSHDQCREGLA